MVDGPQVNAETLELIVDFTKEAPEHQLADVDGLDSKVIQIFGVASAVIALVGVSSLPGQIGKAVGVLLVLALVSYVLTALASAAGLMLRDFRRAGLADNLWRQCWFMEPAEVRHILAEKIATAYAYNKDEIRKKVLPAQISLICCAAEVFFVGLALIVSRA